MTCSGVCLRRFIVSPCSPMIVGGKNSHKHRTEPTGSRQFGEASTRGYETGGLRGSPLCAKASRRAKNPDREGLPQQRHEKSVPGRPDGLSTGCAEKMQRKPSISGFIGWTARPEVAPFF